MPFSVTHVLIPIIMVDLFRDHVLKNTRILPIKYVFLAGLGGLLLDSDLPLTYFLQWTFNFSFPSHRFLFHNIWIPLIFFCLSAISLFILRKKLFKIFLMLSIGVSFHLFLDGILTGVIYPFFPFSDLSFGLNTINFSNLNLLVDFYAGLDAVLLILWLYHEEITHKISDFF